MSEINISELGTLNFKSNTWDYLKSKIMKLNPGADVNWEHFELFIHEPKASTGNLLTLRIRDAVKEQYVNPHRTVEFRYSIDTCWADILRDHLGIPETMHYDSANEFVSYINNNFPSLYASTSPLYVNSKGELTDEMFDDETFDVLPEDLNNKRVTVRKRHFGDRSLTLHDEMKGTTDGGTTSYLIPMYTEDKYGRILTFTFTKEASGTLDFNINGGEFSITGIGVALSEILNDGIEVVGP